MILVYGAITGILYLTGRLNYIGEKEALRKQRVEKYRFILIVSIVGMLIAGLGLLIRTLLAILI